jgi:hypothetical protein
MSLIKKAAIEELGMAVALAGIASASLLLVVMSFF